MKKTLKGLVSQPKDQKKAGKPALTSPINKSSKALTTHQANTNPSPTNAVTNIETLPALPTSNHYSKIVQKSNKARSRDRGLGPNVRSGAMARGNIQSALLKQEEMIRNKLIQLSQKYKNNVNSFQNSQTIGNQSSSFIAMASNAGIGPTVSEDDKYISSHRKKIQDSIKSIKKLTKSNKYKNNDIHKENIQRIGHIRSKTRVQKSDAMINLDSITVPTHIPHNQNPTKQDKVLQKIKCLFNTIQTRLKTSLDSPSKDSKQYQSQNYSFLSALNSSRMITCPPNSNSPIHTSKSVMCSPRYHTLFHDKEKANKNVKSMIDNIGHDMERLEEMRARNQRSMKKYMDEQVGFMGLGAVLGT